MRILVIEDNPELLELLEVVLRHEGHVVVTAACGADGLALARRDPPELILADIEMPGMDGFEVLRNLRQNARLAGCPVVAITACAMAGDRERILSAGFSGYISKPIRAHELGRQLAALLSSITRSP